MIPTEVIQSTLRTFHGSGSNHPCLDPNFVMSEGVYYLVKVAECNWLIDLLPSYIGRFEKHRAVLELKKDENSWRLTITDAEGKIRVSEPVNSCTFPLPDIKLFVEWSKLSGNRWVVSLPSEN